MSIDINDNTLSISVVHTARETDGRWEIVIELGYIDLVLGAGSTRSGAIKNALDRLAAIESLVMNVAWARRVM